MSLLDISKRSFADGNLYFQANNIVIKGRTGAKLNLLSKHFVKHWAIFEEVSDRFDLLQMEVNHQHGITVDVRELFEELWIWVNKVGRLNDAADKFAFLHWG